MNNSHVRRVQALLRSTRRRLREGLMVIEGLRLVREAVCSAQKITWGFYTAAFLADERGVALVQQLQELRCLNWQVTPEVLSALSDTESPQGIVAVLPPPQLPLSSGPGLTLIPDQIRDPGNLGTIFRTAWAAGVKQLLLPPGCVDPTNPKVLRAGMGGDFYLPWRRISWEEISPVVAEDEELWLAEVRGGIAYDRVDWSGAVTLIIGGEAAGASRQARELAAGQHVYIPMARVVESLNAAMAAAILLFEARRQRELFHNLEETGPR
ncbi:MAG: RNA methyltransferase [Anaerolineae bacterium]|nr:RNA methyltransferase [Anaerolineae bacterium]